MSDIIIVHNPLCSKSQKALSLIQEKGIKPKIIEYLKGELTLSLLKTIINALNVHPKDIIRTSDIEFQKLNLDIENPTDALNVIIKHPVILQRPLILTGNRAIIGRPPENVELLFL